MDHPGDDLLPRPGWPKDENRDVRLGGRSDPLEDDDHLAAHFEHVVNRGNVGMIETRYGARFVEHAIARSDRTSVVATKGLERDEAAETRILGEKNRPHSAAAKRSDHTVRPVRSFLGRHRS